MISWSISFSVPVARFVVNTGFIAEIMVEHITNTARKTQPFQKEKDPAAKKSGNPNKTVSKDAIIRRLLRSGLDVFMRVCL